MLAMLYSLGADQHDPEVLAFLQAPGDDDRTARFGRFIGRTAEARLPLVMLAIVAVRAEREVRQAVSGWGKAAVAVAWFELLMAYGYELNEPEIDLLAVLRARIAEAAAKAAAEAVAEEDEELEGEEGGDGPELAAVAEEDEELEGEEGGDGPELAAVAEEDEDEELEDPLDRYLAVVTENESEDADSDGTDDQVEEADDWEARYPEINEPIAA
ncbi:hypothetical protein [Streptomyces rubellomurinus]|uniref:hypothetical protein n=1 Tax=Streptomyces rubellomurinus (strain ATCC 31215) TaxID=359131 RepID=UPI0012FEF142|nr:hypothetical protein [Streptomyces rubellomurinus]